MDSDPERPTPTPGDGSYLADVMLGRLSRWLRLLGFDAAYRNDAEDDALAAEAVRSGRLLLTRDTRLAARRELEGRVLLLRANDTLEQLAEVLAHPHPPLAPFTRCLVCNASLEAMERERVRPYVPAYVAQTALAFTWCPVCRRVYWPGTHRERAIDELQRRGLPWRAE